MPSEGPTLDRAQVALFCGGSLASLVQLTPLLRAIREQEPRLHLLAVTRTDTAPLLQGTELADRVIPLPRAAWIGSPRAWLPAARAARRRVLRALMERPTLCGIGWDRQPRLARAAGAWLCLADVPRRYGFLNEPSGLFTVALPEPPPPNHHEALRLRSLMRALDLRGFACDPRLAVRREERQWASHAFAALGIDPTRPIVAVNPRAEHPLKEWPAHHFAALLDSLDGIAQRLLIAWGPPGRAARVERLCRRPVPRLDAHDPRELAAILARCAALVTGDADPLQLAAAVGTPVVALYGPTDPGWFGPLGNQHRIIQHPVECGPCASYERVPPCPYRHACLRELEVEPVREAVLRILRQTADQLVQLEAGAGSAGE